MTEYTPSDEQMQADWHAYITTPDPENYYYDALSAEEADARWARWLAAHDARVKRDAAREALDGLAAELMETARGCATDGDHGGAGAWRNASAHTYHYRDTNYPETEDQS